MKPHILILIFLFIGFNVWAQEEDLKTDSTATFKPGLTQSDPPSYNKDVIPRFSPLSPNAASIQKFGEYPVNLATGIPDISIPIFTAKSGDLEMPITLRYHAGGIKVHEYASWVGLGWSLDLGAYLNRSVQGIADDAPSGYLNTTITADKDFCNNSTDYAWGLATAGNIQDTRPDIFSYGMPGKNGKFILGYSGQNILKIPDYPINIDYALSGESIHNFKLTDERGIEFGFAEREYQNVTVSGFNEGYTSSWLISSVKSPNTADAITYSYQDGGIANISEIKWQAKIIYDVTPHQGSYYTKTNGYTMPRQISVNTLINQLNPHKVFFENGEIEFIQSGPGSRADRLQSRYLDRIHIYNYENGVKTLIKKIIFGYGYFMYNQQSAHLKLTCITFTDPTETLSETYHFEYWTPDISWPVQSQVNAMDFFGYYNGKTTNQHLISAASYLGVNILYGAANRETVATYAKDAVLKKISYPTGGYTEFDYENHKYKFITSEKPAGGLRIKSIKNVSGNHTELKRYEYASASGEGIGEPATTWAPNEAQEPLIQSLDYSPNPTTNDPYPHSSAQMATFTQDGVNRTMLSTDGIAVYYTTVREYFEGSADPVKNGKNVYTFDFFKDIITTSMMYSTREVKPWKRGNLLSKTVYDKNNNQVSKETYTYQELAVNNRQSAAIVLSPYLFDGITGLDPSCSTTFQTGKPSVKYMPVKYHTGINLPVEKTTLTDGVSYSEKTFYLNNLLVDKTETTGSKPGEILSEQYYYPFSAVYANDPTAQKMTARNMLDYKLETLVNHSLYTNHTPMYREKRTFKEFAGQNARGLAGNILPETLSEAPDGTLLQDRITYTSYLYTGKPTEYYLHDREMPVSLIWGYNQTLLLAEVQNATLAASEAAMAAKGITAANMSKPVPDTQMYAKIKGMQELLPEARMGWFTHRAHVGITAGISPEGSKTEYAYDGLLRLKTVKDHNGKITDVYRYHYSTPNP